MAETYKKLTDYIPLIEDDNFGEWIIDRENDGTIEHPIQFPFVSYSEMVRKFKKDIYEFMEGHPEYGLNRYGEILEQNLYRVGNRIHEWGEFGCSGRQIYHGIIDGSSQGRTFL